MLRSISSANALLLGQPITFTQCREVDFRPLGKRTSSMRGCCCGYLQGQACPQWFRGAHSPQWLRPRAAVDVALHIGGAGSRPLLMV